MMQIQLGRTGVIVLEPENIDRLRKGSIMKVDMSLFSGPPLDTLVIDWTPDIDYCHERLVAYLANHDPSNVQPIDLQNIIRESQKRPEIHDRPNHPTIDLVKLSQSSKADA